MKWSFIVLSMAAIVGSQSYSGSAVAQAALHIPSYPQEVSLVDEGERGFVYRETKHNLRLYTHDGDSETVSTCIGSCSDAWPPLLATMNAKPVGRWTPVTRPDGSQQWAHSGMPVYMRFHDSPSEPTGDGIEGKWHLLPYTKEP